MLSDENLKSLLRDILTNGIAPSTRRAITEDRIRFWKWAKAELNLVESYPIPVNLIILYILAHLPQGDQPGLKVKSIKRYVFSLSMINQQQGGPAFWRDPKIRLLLKRAYRALPNQTPVSKEAIIVPVLRALIATCDYSLWGIRDKAILLTGFAAGGLRRSELAGLNVSDLNKIDNGYLIHIQKSKNDQDRGGYQTPLMGEPAEALRDWLTISGIDAGFVFRGIRRNGSLNTSIAGRSICRIVQKRAHLAGLDPTLFGAHSLRAGFLTEAGNQGIPLLQAMRFSRHRCLYSALAYYRNTEMQRHRAAWLFDLGHIESNNEFETEEKLITEFYYPHDSHKGGSTLRTWQDLSPFR